MQMTKSEIIRSYSESKHKRQQIQILAELNEVDAEYIKEILIEGGVFHRPGPKPGTKKPVEVVTGEPDVLMEAARYGLELLNEKITEKELYILELQSELNELKDSRCRIRKALGETEATSTDASL